jgi:hypothetical protein
MKLADRVIDVHSVGVEKSTKFTIAQTSKMFKILSDSLYSDKVMAVIRELSTNAYDAHVSAKNPNPFLVKLPNHSDPNFTIRDYGTGLSQEDMESLYKTYGASNKNDSNDFVGCLGLGSKSPFAYSKSFTSTSHFNGMKYVYVASLDESGEPSLSLFHTEETSEPNGLEISFAVKNYDFNEFTDKAMRVYHYFNNKPTILGGMKSNLIGHAYSSKNILISGEGWRVCKINSDPNLYPNVYQHINANVIAVMGNIAYPVQTSNLISEKKNSSEAIDRWNKAFGKNVDIAGWEKFITMMKGDIYFEIEYGIGELDMDPSREGLQYTKDVINSLKARTQEIYIELQTLISEKISSAKSLLEAMMMYNQLSEINNGWGTGAKWTDSDGKIHDIDSSSDLVYDDIKGEKALYVMNYRSVNYRSRRMVYQTNSIHHDTIANTGYGGRNKVGGVNKIVFFNNDLKSLETAKKIALEYARSNNCYVYMMVDTKDHTKSLEGFDSLLADIGGKAVVKKISDYKDLIKVDRTYNSGIKRGSVSDQDIFVVINDDIDETKKLATKYANAQYLESLPQNHLDDLPKNMIYVPIMRYSSVDGFPELRTLNARRESKLFDGINVYAIKQNFINDLISDGHNMININDYISSKMDELNDNELKEAATINGLINEATFIVGQRYNTKEYMASGYNSEEIFTNHMVNIFGFDYASFINNEEIVEVIDKVLLTYYFKNNISYPVKKFANHIGQLLNKYNIPITQDKLVDVSRLAFEISTTINIIYSNDEDTKIRLNPMSKTNKTNYFGDINEMKTTLDRELDNSPVMKYIMTIGSEIALDVNETNDPTKNHLKQKSYYTARNKKFWYEKIDDVTQFRNDIASTIK